MEDLLNLVAGRAARLDSRLGQPRFAVVADTNPAEHTVRVHLQPGNRLSGWLQVPAVAVGNGCGVVSMPAPGDQVSVVPQEGDAQHPIIVGRYFSAQARPPVSPISGQPVQPGTEFGVFLPNGSFLHATADGRWHIKGDLVVDGDVSDRHGSLDRLRQNYSAHLHDGVQTGGSRTGATTKPDPE